MHVLVVGPGVMGETLGAAVREALPTTQLTFLGRQGGRAAELAKRFGALVALAPEAVAAPVDYLILTLKPQHAAQVLPTLSPLLHLESFALSVMTGVTITQLIHALGLSRIARAMPNTPGRIGAGLTVWTAQGLNPPAYDAIKRTLSTAGRSALCRRGEVPRYGYGPFWEWPRLCLSLYGSANRCRRTYGAPSAPS